MKIIIAIYRALKIFSPFFVFSTLYLAYKVFFFDIYDRIWVAVDYLKILYLIFIVIFVFVKFVLLVKSRQMFRLFINGVLCGIVICIFLIFGDHYGKYVRFKLNQHSYLSTVKAVESGNPIQHTVKIFQLKNHKVFVFPWPGGIGDNWVGVVYEKSNTLNLYTDDNQLINSKKDFGNLTEFLLDLQHVEFLEDGWYFCFFS